MERPRSRISDYGVYLVVRLVVCVIQAMSWSGALALARGLAWLAHRLDHRHHRVAEENLRHAFPELDEPAIQRLIRDAYEHLCAMAIEIVRMPRVLHQTNAEQYVQYADHKDHDRAMALKNSGRPLMLLTGHFGNWEIISYTMGLVGIHGNVVARRLDNPFLDQFVQHFRRRTGQQILDKNQDYVKILNVLAQRGCLGMAGDQDAGPRGLFVPFLGRPASTYKSIALLSLEYSAPILVYAAARVGHPMKYVLYLEDIIYPEECALEPNPVLAITQRYSDAMERIVRRHPEQYFWVHRRWKSQPKAPRSKKAA